MSDVQPPKTTRRQHITREEEADRCLNHTEYLHGSQLWTVLIFLVIVFGVPIAQHIVEIRRNIARRAEWSPTSGEPKPGLAPQIYDVFQLLPTSEQIKQAKGFWGYWGLIPSVESISAFESSLKENSVLTTSLLSPTQMFMTKFLGAGNEKAYVGKDGWLFYRPDVEYLTSPGFLDAEQLRARSHESTAIQPNPIKAILDFKAQLAKRGIQLVVMPMSTKPMIQPEMLVGPSGDSYVLQNDSFAQFQETLESNGVRVFNPTPLLLDMKTETGPKLYLETDTHWTPDAMHQIALKLGEFLEQKCGLPHATQNQFAMAPKEISNLGDIAEMLKLPADQTIFPKQKVTIEQIVAKDGSPWQADKAGEVMLLGDSFSNIYSLDGMGWGSGAGFGEHLSLAIGRAIDKIVINAGGAFASRRELAAQMARGVDRLAGKKIVVYEFSMRDLSQGDWKMIKMRQPAPSEPTPPVSKPPVITPPVPSLKNQTQLQPIGASSDSLDISRHQIVTVSDQVPPGSWTMGVFGLDGQLVKGLVGGSARVNYTLKSKWDGTNVDGKAVAPGSYVVRVEGTRPDKSVFMPVEHALTVVNGKQTGLKGIQPPTRPPGPGDKGTHPAPDNKGKPPVTPSTGNNQANTKAPPPTIKPTKPAEQGLFVTGRIASRAVTPKPGSVPYKDCLIALQLTDLKASGGTVKGPNIVVYVWGMRDNVLVDGAYSVGQTLRFKLTPWASVDSKYGGYNRQELESDDALSWQAFWGEIIK